MVICYVLCSDFKLGLDTSNDYVNYKYLNHNARSRTVLSNKMSNGGLIDPFRQFHGRTRKYMWKTTSLFNDSYFISQKYGIRI